MRVKKFDTSRVEAQVKEAAGKALSRLGRDMIVDDINVYVPLRDRHLINSAKSNIVDTPTGFKVTWSTPYARRQYEEHKVGVGKNRLAVAHWDEVAEQEYRSRWVMALKKYIEDTL